MPGNPNADKVFRFSVGSTDTPAPSTSLVNQGSVGQFNMVGGLGVRPDGQVLVTDDVALTLPDEPIGTGRLYQIGSPAANIASGPTGPEGKALDPAFTSDATPEFTVDGNGPFQCVVRAAGVTPAAEDWTPCGEDAGAVSVGTLADGAYVLSVRSSAGATPETQDDTSLFVPESLRFTVDTGAPGTPHVSVAQRNGRSNASPWFTFTPASPDEGSDVEWRCRLNGVGSFAPCHPGRTYPLNDDGTSKLAAGNTIEVKAVDLAGNETADARSVSWSADTSIPAVTITAPGGAGRPVVRQRGSSATFAFTVQDGDAPEAARTGCRLDGAAWKECDRGGETFTGLAEGVHVFKAHARDAYGNMSPTAIRRVVVDRTGPAIAIAGVPVVTGPSVIASFSVAGASQSEGEGAARFFCSLDGGAAAPCPNPLSLTGLADGAHTLAVVAEDDLGNRGATQTVSFSVTGNPPPAGPPATGGPGPGAGGGQGRGQGGGAGGRRAAVAWASSRCRSPRRSRPRRSAPRGCRSRCARRRARPPSGSACSASAAPGAGPRR